MLADRLRALCAEYSALAEMGAVRRYLTGTSTESDFVVDVIKELFDRVEELEEEVDETTIDSSFEDDDEDDDDLSDAPAISARLVHVVTAVRALHTTLLSESLPLEEIQARLTAALLPNPPILTKAERAELRKAQEVALQETQRKLELLNALHRAQTAELAAIQGVEEHHVASSSDGTA